MKNDYSYSITEIRKRIIDIFKQRGVDEKDWVTTDLCHLIAKEKRKSFKDGVYSAIESLNLEAIPITRELVKQAEERGFKEGYKRAYEASLFGKRKIRNT